MLKDRDAIALQMLSGLAMKSTGYNDDWIMRRFSDAYRMADIFLDNINSENEAKPDTTK